jgi:hypothetical protein
MVAGVRAAVWSGVVVAAAGCPSSDDAALEILGNVRPDGACDYSPSASQPEEFYSEGYLDIAFGRPYVAHLLVRNGGADPVRVEGGFRNVWYEPQHTEMIRGDGEAARKELVLGAVTIPGGGRRIVEVDPLGEGFIVYKRQFEGVIAQGRVPDDEEALTSVVLAGDADGTVIESRPWEFSLIVGIGRLVDFSDPAWDSASYPGADCCGQVSGSSVCEAGQNWNLGPCHECASCWPELCNRAIAPSACGLGSCAP